MTQTILKIKNGTIKLPREINTAWKEARVLLFPSEDTLLVKKVKEPIQKLSDIAKRISPPRMSMQSIQREVASYRKGQ